MKIIQIFPGKVWGGAEQYVLDLGRALQKQRHEMFYMSTNSNVIKERTQGKVPVETLPFICTWDFFSIQRLSHILKESGTDVVHIHDTRFVPIAIAAKKRAHSRVRIVLTRHIARSSHVLPFFRSAFKELHCIIFVSELAKRMWANANPWMPVQKMHVVHNSIPVSRQESGIVSLRARYQLTEDMPLIVFAGRVRRSKGCEVLVQALGKIRHLPFTLVFIGASKPADYPKRLLHLARAYGIEERILFYGFSDNARLLIREADIGVAPSIVKEACALSPMEFMQAGKCIIATNNGSQPEYIQSGETGLLISPDNPEELAAAIQTALEQKLYRTVLGEKAKSYFDNQLNYEKFLGRITRLYEADI